ncbi:MAG: DNA alkylation repair protein [Anaerolineae bacterium]|nr:DNA alkylation repair protein [Anaerolineae bacterium]
MNVSNANVILTEMESLGTEQARKTYKRHGVGDNVYGVSYSDLGKYQKKLKTNHEIALDLWASGIHDAQILALMIADPQQADSDTLDKWVKTLNNYVITDAFSAYVAKTPFARQKAEAWIKSDHEWIAAAGWDILGVLAGNDASLPDSYFEPYLAIIERDLHTAKNRTRHSMNNALIAIGARNPNLHPNAVATAKRIGKVKVDHGLTNCKIPDAISYMQKVIDHRAEKAQKSKVKA